MFTRSKLIVAHPDDECLWFSSILEQVDGVVICYRDHPKIQSVGETRKMALESINCILAEKGVRPFLSLGLPEVDTFASTDWDNPIPNEWGLQLTHPAAQARYEANFSELVEIFKPLLSECDNVFTHNPWGEYGHPDHVQLHKVLTSLQRELKYTLWCNNYASNQTLGHLMRYVSGFHPVYVTLNTNVELAQEIAEAYRATEGWTWFDEFEWFSSESFMHGLEESQTECESGSLAPLNFMKLNFQAPRPPQPTFKQRVRNKLSGIIG